MATIPTPTEAKTSDDSSLVSHIVGIWARATPVLSAILTKFVSETGLKSLMSDSTTLDDSNKIASSKAVKSTNRRYVTENYTDGAAATPTAGSIALGRGGQWVINGDGHLTSTSATMATPNLGITCRRIIGSTDAASVSSFGSISLGGQVTSTGTIESQGTVKGLKLEAGNSGVTSSGIIQSTGTVKGLKLEAGAAGVTSSGHIDAGVKQVRGANISKFTAKFRRGSSGFSLVKEFSESGFTITYPSATEIRIHYGSVSMTNFAVLTALRMLIDVWSVQSITISYGEGDYVDVTTDTTTFPVGSDLVLDFIY